jgi:hypothetical protein
MAFPETVQEMEQRGYKHLNDGTCNVEKGGCGDQISWWETPNGKKIPMNMGTANVHWESCPNADDFRGGSSKGTGEPFSVQRIKTGNCEFCGETAVLKVKLGTRSWCPMCASHGNQFYLKLKHSGKQGKAA